MDAASAKADMDNSSDNVMDASLIESRECYRAGTDRIEQNDFADSRENNLMALKAKRPRPGVDAASYMSV
tara:strand:+ start:1386 stop:1595 length:210 start_codon:yes stop_codon:yes gene_type:complete